uniref:Uncharacterized protein n=1 Tax=Tanacetum cinerariifolium TaxID=118510 RepID=A0A699HDU0_TANCI|nr:hypothetical protein [Tanacetum cinerariifolium]
MDIFKIRRRFFKRCFDLVIDVKGDLFEWWFFNVGSESEFSSAVIAINSSNLAKSFSLRMVPSMEWRILLLLSRRASKYSSKISSMMSILKHVSSFEKGLPKIRGTLLSSSIFKITKSTGKVHLPTSTSIFLAIPTRYWNDRSANLTLILVGLRVSRDNFAYKEYGMRLMLAPRLAKALHKKALLKLHGIWKLPWNGDCGTGSRSDNTVSSPHGFVIHGIDVLKGNETVTEVIDVENWWIDNSRMLRRIVSLIERNSSVSSMKSLIQSTFRKYKHLDILAHEYKDYAVTTSTRLFRIQEQVIREYVSEFFSSFTFREHIAKLDNVDTMVIQLGGIRMRRHSEKEKVTLDDLFLLYSIDEGARVDVPWHVAKFFTDKAKRYKKKSQIVGAYSIGRIDESYGLMTSRSLRSVTLVLETSLLSVANLMDFGICRCNGLGLGELVDDLPDNEGNEAAGAGEGQDDSGGVRRRHNMSFTNRLRAMDEILGTLSTKGVNFMSSTLVYSIDPSSSPNPFGLFDDASAGPSTSQDQGNDMNEE